MAEKLASDQESIHSDISPELEYVIKDALDMADEYVAAVKSGLDVPDEIEIYHGHGSFDESDISDDSIVMRKLIEVLSKKLNTNEDGDSYGMLPGKNSNQATRVVPGEIVDIVYKYEFGTPDADLVADTQYYSLNLAKAAAPNSEANNGREA